MWCIGLHTKELFCPCFSLSVSSIPASLLTIHLWLLSLQSSCQKHSANSLGFFPVSDAENITWKLVSSRFQTLWPFFWSIAIVVTVSRGQRESKTDTHNHFSFCVHQATSLERICNACRNVQDYNPLTLQWNLAISLTIGKLWSVIAIRF